MRTLAACSVAVVLVSFLTGGCAPEAAVEGPLIDEVAFEAQDILRTWQTPLPLDDGETVTDLTVDGPVVMAKTSARRLFVVNAEQGRFLCYIRIGRQDEPIYGITRDQDRIYIVGLDGLREYALESGRFLRGRQPDFAPSTGAVRIGDEMFLGSQEGRLYALLQRNLVRAWSTSTLSGITSGPTVALGRLVAVASADGRIRAIRSRDIEVWKFQCNGRISSDLVADGGKLFAACEDTKLYCLDAVDGRLLWQQFLEAPLKQPPVPVPANGLVYQYSPAVGMNALQINQRGEPAWQAPREDLRQFVATTPLRSFLVNADGQLEAVNARTGRSEAVLPTPPGALFATNRQDSSLFLSTPEGTVIALRDRRGTYIDRNELLTGP